MTALAVIAAAFIGALIGHLLSHVYDRNRMQRDATELLREIRTGTDLDDLCHCNHFRRDHVEQRGACLKFDTDDCCDCVRFEHAR